MKYIFLQMFSIFDNNSSTTLKNQKQTLYNAIFLFFNFFSTLLNFIFLRKNTFYFFAIKK